MKTKEQYIESLRKMNFKLYMFGERVENIVDNPIVRPSMNSVAMTYELAQDPQYEDTMTAVSGLTGKKVNRFCHLHQNTDDLIKKVKMQRLLGQKTAACFQRCVGMDAVNAVDSVTYEIDQQKGKDYHKRFRKWLEYMQDNDLTVDGAMTDPKGDRSLSPSQQKDPDLFLRIVEERPDGIVVRGAKVHQTGALNSHEILIMPTIAMGEADSEKDLRSPEIGHYVGKYLQGVSGIPTEHRLRILRLIENITLGTAAVGYRTESMHGAGSPQAQRIVISRQANLGTKKELAKKIAGIPE